MKFMTPIVKRVKPASGFAHFLHLILTAILPILLFILVRIGFAGVGAALIILAKWRMFAVKPRHWLANIRANAVDLMVGVSLLVFMINSASASWQLVWAVSYAVWLLAVKPASGVLMVSIQALVGQTLALMALFLALGDADALVLMLFAWIICYMAARHFFFSFDENLTKFLAYMWGYFGAALTWVLSRWLLFYGVVAQPTMLLTVIGFGLAALYYLEKTDRLSDLLRKQFITVMLAIVVVIVVFSDWGDKTV
jgi:hypothetical protein